MKKIYYPTSSCEVSAKIIDLLFLYYIYLRSWGLRERKIHRQSNQGDFRNQVNKGQDEEFFHEKTADAGSGGGMHARFFQTKYPYGSHDFRGHRGI
jgi:hypothetical protein